MSKKLLNKKIVSLFLIVAILSTGLVHALEIAKTDDRIDLQKDENVTEDTDEDIEEDTDENLEETDPTFSEDNETDEIKEIEQQQNLTPEKTPEGKETKETPGFEYIITFVAVILIYLTKKIGK